MVKKINGFIESMEFDGVDLWSLGNDFAGNAISFGVDNSSSSHADNHQNNFLVLRKGPIHDINGRFGAVGKNFSISFTKTNTKFWLNVLYNNDNSYLFVNGKKSIS